MSWIESHQSLLTHRKTLRAANRLGSSVPLLIGHLHILWWWGLDNAKDHGHLGDVTDDELAAAAGWPVRKSKVFVGALVSAGFLDKRDDGYVLHDWWSYAGKLNAKRAKDRARKAEVAGSSSGIPAEVAAKSQAPNQPAPNGAYLPNKPTTTNQPSAAEVLAGRPNAFRLYEQLFGKGVSPLIAERLMEYEQSHSPECLAHCFQEAAEAGARSVRLVYAILDRHTAEGCYAGRPNATSNTNISADGLPATPGLTPSERAEALRSGALKPVVVDLD